MGKNTGIFTFLWLLIIFLSLSSIAYSGVLEEVFMEPACNGNLDRIKKLEALSISIDINAKDDDGNTAFSCAALNVHFGAVDQLIRYGADICHKDTKGRTAVDIAQKQRWI
jgi:ankyrin repeat protein